MKKRPKATPNRKPVKRTEPASLSPERLAAARERFAEMDAPRRALEAQLLSAIKSRLPVLEKLLADVDDHWAAEDLVYRFYHQSFKVFSIQGYTTNIVDALRALLPDTPLNKWFAEIVTKGTGVTFALEHNRRWLEVTRPMLEAFFHARYFLAMVCRYGRELDEPPTMLPSGWAAVLYLYGLR